MKKPVDIVPAAVLEQHIAVLGKTGSGKTSTAKLLIEQVVAQGARVCILDPIKSDWWGLTSSADGKRAGLPFHILGGPRGHVPLHASAGKVIGEIVANASLPLSIVDMADFEPGGQAKFFTDFAPTLLRKMRGVVYLVIEEAHLFAPKERSGIGAENLSIHWAKTLATAGRSKGVRLVLVTQRTQALHNALLGSCDTMIAHRLTAPADQEPVVKWLKANTTKEVLEQVSSSLSSLKTGAAWLCSGEAKRFEVLHFPRIQTFDNTATPTGNGDTRVITTAPVDQAKLRAIIGDAVDQAKADDPKELKKTVANLTRDLADERKRREILPATTKAASTPALTDADRALIEKLATAITDRTKTLQQSLDENDAHTESMLKVTLDRHRESTAHIVAIARGDLQKTLDKASVKKLLEKLNGLALAPVSQNRDNRLSRPAPQVPAKTAPIRQASTGTRHLAPSNGSAEGITPAKQKILNALAFFEGIGVQQADKTQLALIVGVSPTSGGYFNNLGSLRSSGLIEYPQGGTVALTEAGRSIASTDGVPDTTDALHNAIKAKLPPAKWKILEALIAVYPNALPKDELAKEIAVSPTSGGYFNNLGSLRTLGLLDYPRPSEVVALPVLFLEGR